MKLIAFSRFLHQTGAKCELLPKEYVVLSVKRQVILNYLNRSQLQVALGRNLDIITQAEGRENFLHLRNELWHMTCGFYLAELVDRFVEDSTPHLDIYALLLEALRYLDADASALEQQRAQNTDVNTEQVDEHGHTRLLLRYFELHLLTCNWLRTSPTTVCSLRERIAPGREWFQSITWRSALPTVLPFLGAPLIAECSQSLTFLAAKKVD